MELGSGEGIDETGLGDNKEEDLGPSEGREFVSLEGKGTRRCGMRHTCFPVVEHYTILIFRRPAFLSCFLIVVLAAATVDGVQVVDEGVFSHS